MSGMLDRSADVVVVGGGVMGTSIALHLALRKIGRVVLCEKWFVGSGPTGRSSGLLRRHYTLETYARMATRSLEIFKAFEELTGTKAEITWCGMLSLVGPEDLEAMKTTVAMLRRIGADAEALGLDDLRRLVPQLNCEGLAGAGYDPTTGYADAAGVTNAYAQRARALGVRIHEMTAVTGLTLQAGRIAGVRTDQGEIAAPAVVNAAGAWAAGVARMAGIDLPIAPSRVQVAIFRLPPTFGALRVIIGDNVHRCYMRPESGDLLLVGTRSQPGALPPVNPDAFNERVDEERVVRASEILTELFPAMESGQAVGGYASLYDMTPDGHFILEADPRAPGLYTAAGFSGHGFKHSPIVGRIMADLVAEGRTAELDIEPFSSRRITDGRPPWRGLYRASAF